MAHGEMARALYNKAANEVDYLVGVCHGAAKRNGWWPEGAPVDVPRALCLIHSEVSEALEGHRRDKMDEHLPHHPSIAVELADAIIRICDLAGALRLDLGSALRDKLRYNDERADHKADARAAPGGKKF